MKREGTSMNKMIEKLAFIQTKKRFYDQFFLPCLFSRSTWPRDCFERRPRRRPRPPRRPTQQLRVPLILRLSAHEGRALPHGEI